MSKVLPSEHTYKTYCNAKIKQNKNHMIARIATVSVIWALIGGFLISPLSKANIKRIDGNAVNFGADYIYEMGDFKKNSFIWHNDYKQIANELRNHRYLNNIEFSYGLFGLNVKVDEVILVGKSSDENVTYYLSDGTSILASSIEDKLTDPVAPEKMFIGQYKDSVPTIDKTNYSDDERPILVKELGHMDHDLLLKVKNVKCNDDFKNFNASKLTFNKEALGLEQDLIINIDTTQISDLLNSNNIDLIKEDAANKNLYEYMVDTKDDKINFYPYTSSDK